LADQPDPRLDGDGKFAFILQCQLRGYSSLDTPVSSQIAITASILRKVHDMSISPADKALCELFIGEFFFAMHSCKYVKVSGKRKTMLLVLRNFWFIKGLQTFPHSDPFLHQVDCVTNTFKQQKRDSKGDMISQHHFLDLILCPVKIPGKNRFQGIPLSDFTADQIGLYPARSGAAMAMYLAGGITIMLLSR